MAENYLKLRNRLLHMGGFLDALKGSRPLEPAQVYCQNCNGDLTAAGGDVSSTGRIYCHGYKADGDSRCLDHEMQLMLQGEMPPTPFAANYCNTQEVQQAIRRRELTEFGPLEQELQPDS